METAMKRMIQVEILTADAFKDYGKVIDLPEYKAGKIGDGWDCWWNLGTMDVAVPVGTGLVLTRERLNIVDSMERHVDAVELLLPFDKAIIQPVALCSDPDDPNAKPDPSTVRCFRIEPGQSIIMDKGIWHSAAYSVSGETRYFFAAEIKPDKFGMELKPWVTFINDETITFY
jgi:ureidoglycolate lyase